MCTVDEEIPKTLRSLEMRLATLKVENTDELARIGAELEDVLTSLPEELIHPSALLTVCLEMLQELYLSNTNDFVAGIQATRNAVGALESYFLSGKYASLDPLAASEGKLLQILGRPLAESAAPETVNLCLVSADEAPESMLIDEEGIVQDFLVESYENLDRLDLDLLALEKDPQDHETISSIFRTIHTIKGTCGFFGFSRLESLSHAGESLLSLLRTGDLRLSPAITDALLALEDAIRQILGSIETTHSEGTVDYTALTQTLTRLQTQEGDEAKFTPELVVMEPVLREPENDPQIMVPTQDMVPTQEEYGPIHGRVGDVLISQGYIQVGDLTRALREQEAGDQRRLGEILITMGLVTGDIVERALHSIGSAAVGAQGTVGDASIRVDVGLLDSLMNLVGELVLTRNQIVQLLQGQGSALDTALVATAQRLNLITSELQEGVMHIRMQPIGNVWNKFPRVVRDLAQTCGKQVRLEMEGRETDLDKTLIEAIKDPLTHLIRNAIDHGIERSDVRVASGKSAEGLLLLRAYHEGGQVNIEITDDGGGIDSGRIKAKAIERGFITPELATQMSEWELLQLIFLPGFSTAATVTSVSGRGVGMDVVKTNIEKIGGTIDIQSRIKKGTTIKVKIPLTLAIVPALFVSAGEERYAIPQVSLLELVRLPSARTGIERIQGIPVYRLRGKLLPLLFLNQELALEKENERDEERGINIVVLQANEQQFGLVVDSIADTEEIVVKPLSAHLKSVDLFAGATIRGDGRVALILDVMALALRANLAAETHRGRVAVDSMGYEAERERVQTFLLFQVGRNGRMALPLSSVARLEEFPLSLVEEVGRLMVVQYRGRIMPLLHLMGSIPGTQSAESDVALEPLQVVVIGEEPHCVGMVVDRIVDIVEEVLTLEEQAPEGPVVGTMVIQGRVTQILDTKALLSVLQEENDGNTTPVLHFLSGGVSFRTDIDSGSGSASAPAHNQSAAGLTHARGADQPARTDSHGDRPAQAAPTRRAA